MTSTPTIYAIGDVHGRDDLLIRLLDMIDEDCAALDPIGKPLLVLLGDYVDRGRQSPQVLDRLITLRQAPEFETHLLLGNHEAAMLDFLDGSASGRGWARFGGRATMESYGVSVPLREDDEDGWLAARESLRASVPQHHIALLQAMELTFEVGSLLFVHAGLRPNVPLALQAREDLLGIRGEFLDWDDPFEHFVIHGHSPVETPDLRSNRLNLDTGAYMTGRLSAARYDGRFSRFLTTNA